MRLGGSATQEAGRLAGLDVMDIINEPTAAAVAFGYQHGFLNLRSGGAEKPLRVLVYDLGGGTFDVSVLEITGTEFRALATDGDVQLGGRDFDERLVSHLAEQFQIAHGVDPRSDPQDAAQLWLDAIEAKHSLSERTKTNVVCFHAGIRFRQEVSRQQFEDMTRDLVERSETTASLVVNQAGLTWDQIDRVLLVGGADADANGRGDAPPRDGQGARSIACRPTKSWPMARRCMPRCSWAGKRKTPNRSANWST